MTWVGDLEWTELAASIEMGVVVALFRILFKGEPEVRESEKLKAVR